MKRRHVCIRPAFVLMVLSLCVAASSIAAGAEEVRRPNIILCMADDQGWGEVAYNGHPVLKTPHLDAMAGSGLRFDRFYAAAPVCSPTRGSVMTGRHPNRFGCFSWGHTLRPQEHTLARILKAAGYATGHFGKWHLGPVEEGSPVNPGACGFDEWLSAPNFYDNDPILSRKGTAVQMKGESSMVAVDAALEFMRDRARSPEPFLAVIWFGSPHLPHEAAEEDLALYPDEKPRQQHLLGEISGLDRAMGKLRSELREMGIHENTLVWYCSDNGGTTAGTTGGRGRKGQIYEGGLRVPTIIEWPARITKPRITSLPANTSDILPTILEVVGAKRDPLRPLDGISLVPAITGEMSARREPMGFWAHPQPGMRTPSREWMAELMEAQRQGKRITQESRLRLDAGRIDVQHSTEAFPGHAAWLDWPWKLHRIDRADAPMRFELYNLVDDPQESADLSEKQPQRVKTMRAAMEQWLAGVVNSLNGADYGQTYMNPVIDRIGPADPHVIRYRDKYYLYPTIDSKSYDVFVSDDLVYWEPAGKCYTDSRGGVWAPDVFHHVRGDGKLYLYYTVDDPEGGKLIGVAVADSPLGPFEDHGTLVRTAIDAHLFQDDDGKMYLYYADISPGYIRIAVVGMADPLTRKGDSVVVIEPTDAWERDDSPIAEGPWMLKHQGRYYLMYSGSPSHGPNYAIGYATATSPMGPFEKYSGNPIAKQGNGVFGPGHHCVVKGPQDRLWMVYHQQNSAQTGWHRFLAIDPLWFDDRGVIHAKTTRGTFETMK